MDIFKYFGVDMNNDTLSQIIEKLSEKGIGNACIVPKGDDDHPLGMFLLLADRDAIPYVERALEQYDEDTESDEVSA